MTDMNETTERQQMRLETDARAADQAVSVAIACIERAGWRDLALDLAKVKVETSRRSRDVMRESEFSL